MYLCVAETTKVVVSAVKPTNKNDRTHPGQFEYSIWIELIRDSAEIINRHGLFPQPTKMLKPILSDLNTFHLHWTEPSKKTKDNVATLVKNTFAARTKLLSLVGRRSLGQPSSFNERWPLSGVQLALQAYKIRREKTHDCILTGGKYQPFDGQTDNPRDSIQFKIDGMPPLKAISFEQLSLNSDRVLLNPQVLAAMIYVDKSITDKDKEKIATLKSRYKGWKSGQRGVNSGYLSVRQLHDPDGGGGGGGGGGGEGPNGSKRLT